MRARIAGCLAVVVVAAVVVAGATSAGSTRLGGWIVYWSENPRPSIRAVRPDGSKNHLILQTRQNAKRPRLSPDTTWVAFDGTPPGKPPFSDFDIQLVRLDGGGLRALTDTADWDVDAQWSRDGAWLAFTRSPPSPQGCGGSSIWIMRADGSDPRRVVAGCGARWSPDGSQLVYTGPIGQRLLVVDRGGGVRTLLRAPRAFLQAAGWSPDGKRILFTRTGDQTGLSGSVYVINADGTGARRLGRGFAACWSPDGSKILYTTSFSSPLYVMDRDGTHKRRIASIKASEPDWR